MQVSLLSHSDGYITDTSLAIKYIYKGLHIWCSFFAVGFYKNFSPWSFWVWPFLKETCMWWNIIRFSNRQHVHPSSSKYLPMFSSSFMLGVCHWHSSVKGSPVTQRKSNFLLSQACQGAEDITKNVHCSCGCENHVQLLPSQRFEASEELLLAKWEKNY